MKIAMGIFRWFPYGGLQKDFLRMAELLAERGHVVFAYCGNGSEDIPADARGIRWTRLATPGLTNHARARAFESRFAAACRRERFDCVVGFNKMAGLDFYFAGDTCLAERTRARRCGSLLRLLPRYATFLSLERAVFSPGSATKIFTIADRQRQSYERCWGTPRERFVSVPFGMDARCGNVRNPAEARERKRRELGLAPGDFAVALVGSDFKRKGAARAIAAVAALPETLYARTKLFLVGASDADKFNAFAAELGARDAVRVLGERDDVPELMCAADLLVHPALEEAGGSVLLEAAVSGLPVVCTDVCGFAPKIAQWAGGTVLPSPFRQTELNFALERAVAEFAAAGEARRFPPPALQRLTREEALVECVERFCAERQKR